MAKKLTKAEMARIRKDPARAIREGKMKMKKQEVPFGGIAKAAAKGVAKLVGKKTAAKGSSRQAGDYPVSGSRANKTIPRMIAIGGGSKPLVISKNVGIKNGVSPSGKVIIRGGAGQVIRQNERLIASLTKAEAKANARGLKAANKPLSKGNAKRVEQIRQQTGYIAFDRRPTPKTVADALKRGDKSFLKEAKKIAMREARKNGPAKKISPAQKALNAKKK